jgi:hypothetical protein
MKYAAKLATVAVCALVVALAFWLSKHEPKTIELASKPTPTGFEQLVAATAELRAPSASSADSTTPIDVHGRVVDESERPIEAFAIRAIHRDANNWFVEERTWPNETRACGEFDLLGLAPGRWEIAPSVEGRNLAQARKFNRTIERRMDFVFTAPTRDVEPAQYRDANLVATFLDELGAPLAGWVVTCAAAKGGPFEIGATGELELGALTSGDVTLGLFPPLSDGLGPPARCSKLRLSDGESKHVTLRLRRDHPVRIAGAFVSSPQFDLEGTEVSATPVIAAELVAPGPWSATIIDGRFDLLVPTPGRYLLALTAPSLQPIDRLVVDVPNRNALALTINL